MLWQMPKGKTKMTSKQEEFINLVLLAFNKQTLKKLVLSRPKASETTKISARLCEHRGRKILAFEYSLPGNTVSHKNILESEIRDTVAGMLEEYEQANLITTAGDAEWKVSKKGKEALLGADKLTKSLTADKMSFEKAIESLDTRKVRMLSGKKKSSIWNTLQS